MKIPFNRPWLSGKEESYVLESIRRLTHCGNGIFSKKCTDFIEQEFNIKKAFLTPSGTDSLEMGCILMGLKPGDEVIMPSYTFSSTANAVVLQGATPIFVDIRPDTFNIDETKIEAAITSKTKAIMPIVYGGISAEMDIINAIAEKNNLFVFEDAAQGMDASYKKKPVGSTAKISIYSFHETKNHGCGEGGALLLNDKALIRQAEFIQEKGTDRSLVVAGMKNKYSWVTKGSSFLLSDMLAAFLFAQLEAKNEIKQKRKVIWERYHQALEPFLKKEVISTQIIPCEIETNFHAFYILFRKEIERGTFLNKMKERGVSSYIGYVPLHNSPMGLSLNPLPKSLPVTEHVGSCLARLPLYTGMTTAELDFACENLIKTLGEMF
jgi:dTDP-4-amino-4,6-dideoxygalactose transaminase